MSENSASPVTMGEQSAIPERSARLRTVIRSRPPDSLTNDVSLPRPYPTVYAENGWYWNEQYLLQAFLAFNSRFEVLWAGNHLLLRYPGKVTETFPELAAMRERFPQSEPTSFWMWVRP